MLIEIPPPMVHNQSECNFVCIYFFYNDKKEVKKVKLNGK